MKAGKQPVLAVRLGRGRTGGTTGLDWLVQRAQAGGRDVIIADADVKNPTLSNLYNGRALQPPSKEASDIRDWLTTVLDKMASAECSAALDLGGGDDRILQEYDLDLASFCESVGVAALAFYSLGPEPDDLDHAYSVFSSGVFRPEHALIVLNGALARQGQTVATAFGRTLKSDQLRAMIDAGAKPIIMKRLACLEQIRELRLSLNEAAQSREVLGPVGSFMVRRWLVDLEEECVTVSVQEWLP